jgi:tRNA A-37 threonylcarbamoyl transferase component Bud32
VSRSATLVVVDRNGNPLGAFGPIVASMHVQDTSDLTEQAAAAGLDVTVLRVLRAPIVEPSGVIRCIYLAEALGPIAPGRLTALPVDVDLADHPLRLSYARPGGVADDLAWAQRVLHEAGRGKIAHARQERSWNLSCVHRLTLADGTTVWLKVVPPFFYHEGAMLQFMRNVPGAMRVPHLLGSDRDNGRVLMEHVEGPLMWGAPLPKWSAVIDRFIATQGSLCNRVDELLALGAPDWRNRPFANAIARLVQRDDVRSTLDAASLRAVDAIVDALPRQLDALAACGIPPTLVHGDVHQGNVLDGADGPVLLDWGDSSVGHPFFDLAAFCHRLPPAEHAAIEAQVIAAWQSALPGADPARAAELIRPIAALCKVRTYRNFLDHIEPSEHHYHAIDVPDWLNEAVRRAAASQKN